MSCCQFLAIPRSVTPQVDFQTGNCLQTLPTVFFRKLRMAQCTAFLYCGNNFEPAPSQNLLQSPHHSSGLIGKDIQWPRCAAGTYYYCLLILMFGNGNFAHHTIDNAVEKDFQRSRHISPIARCTYDADITGFYQSEYTLGIVFGQDAAEC